MGFATKLNRDFKIVHFERQPSQILPHCFKISQNVRVSPPPVPLRLPTNYSELSNSNAAKMKKTEIRTRENISHISTNPNIPQFSRVFPVPKNKQPSDILKIYRCSALPQNQRFPTFPNFQFFPTFPPKTKIQNLPNPQHRKPNNFAQLNLNS